MGTGALPPGLMRRLVLLALHPWWPSPPRCSAALGESDPFARRARVKRFGMSGFHPEEHADPTLCVVFHPWAQAMAPMLRIADVGLGLGAALGVVLVIPAWFVWRRDHPNWQPPAGTGPSASGGGPPQFATG